MASRPSAALLLAAATASVQAAGPTGYSMHAARVVASRPVCANGRSRLLRVEPAGAPSGGSGGRELSGGGDDWVREYGPGHVLALELSDASGVPRRGPYTVSRAGAGSLDVVYRVIDPARPPPDGAAAEHAAACAAERKSALMAAARPGDALSLGGRFHTPIWDGIDWRGCAAVFLISSGVGVGPQLGFAAQCAAAWCGAGGEGVVPPPVRLFAGYREAGDVACAAELDEVSAGSGAEPHAGSLRRFEWAACLSAPTDGPPPPAALGGGDGAGFVLCGRTTTAAPPRIAATARALGAPLSACHFHIIGRGSLVSEWTAALAAVGVPGGRCTHETYFGHGEPHDAEAVGAIARALAAP